MKYTRPFGLLVALAALLLLPTGSASATQVTSPAGTVYTGEIKAESEEHVILHSENAPTPFTIECNGSVTGAVTQHGSSVTSIGHVSSLVFSNCTNGATLVINKPGTLEIHTDNKESSDGNGTLTSTGAEITMHVPVLNIKCIFTTNGTDVGTLTGSKNQAGEIKRATLDINSATIPRTGGSAFCGTGGFWTGSYKFTTPNYLDVD